MKWVVQNWVLVAVIAYAVSSEIIGYLPCKSNGVLQCFLRMLGKICGRG
jgi:hypothetical protein